MKRRIIIFILVSLLVFSNYNPIMGKTPKGIMLITETDQYADSYIKRSIVSLLIPQEYHGNYSKVRILNGLYVYGYTEYDLYIYPVTIEDKVVATIQVIKDSTGSYCATYSAEYVEILNEAFKQAKNSDSLMLIYHNNTIKAMFSDFNTLDILRKCGYTCQKIEQYELNISIDGLLNQSRDIIYICNWTTHDIYTNGSIKCIPYSLHNILYNKGQYYKAKTSSEALNIAMGNTGIYTYSQVQNYCSNNNINYYDSINSGKLAWGYVYQSILSGNYVMAICTQTLIDNYGNINVNQHYIGIIGVSVSSTASSIIIYDPHGTGNGKYTVTYGSGDIAYTMNVNSETRTNTWNKGYFRDLQ